MRAPPMVVGNGQVRNTGHVDRTGGIVGWVLMMVVEAPVFLDARVNMGIPDNSGIPMGCAHFDWINHRQVV